ncbi:MAG: hypothetical protein PHT51_01900 [Patescibacteria group bacterium]|nr:hypothetical protein [Patescibacteria group bacterium]MDD4610349.1 hypothetical protein [Patescibacteria group bacterium]
MPSWILGLNQTNFIDPDLLGEEEVDKGYAPLSGKWIAGEEERCYLPEPDGDEEPDDVVVKANPVPPLATGWEELVTAGGLMLTDYLALAGDKDPIFGVVLLTASTIIRDRGCSAGGTLGKSKVTTRRIKMQAHRCNGRKPWFETRKRKKLPISFTTGHLLPNFAAYDVLAVTIAQLMVITGRAKPTNDPPEEEKPEFAIAPEDIYEMMSGQKQLWPQISRAM